MKNIFYEYVRDKSPVMKAFIGKSSVAKAHFHRNIIVREQCPGFFV